MDFPVSLGSLLEEREFANGHAARLFEAREVLSRRSRESREIAAIPRDGVVSRCEGSPVEFTDALAEQIVKSQRCAGSLIHRKRDDGCGIEGIRVVLLEREFVGDRLRRLWRAAAFAVPSCELRMSSDLEGLPISYGVAEDRLSDDPGLNHDLAIGLSSDRSEVVLVFHGLSDDAARAGKCDEQELRGNGLMEPVLRHVQQGCP